LDRHGDHCAVVLFGPVDGGRRPIETEEALHLGRDRVTFEKRDRRVHTVGIVIARAAEQALTRLGLDEHLRPG
jgi:hypothetical protein